MSEFSERIVKQTEALLHFQHDETLQETTPERLHEALGQVIMMEISDKWTKTKRRQAPGRRAFYFSAEYLVGRLVYSNLFNLGILRGMKAAFAERASILRAWSTLRTRPSATADLAVSPPASLTAPRRSTCR